MLKISRQFSVVILFVALAALIVAEDQLLSTSKSAPKLLTEQDQAALPPTIRALIPLHKPLGKPLPGEWLDKHEEVGQTYPQYLAARPIRATTERRTLWIQPLGDFSAEERKIVHLTAEYLGLCFQLPVKMSDDLPLTVVPEDARRVQR
jgi:archaemetzincin